MREVKTCSRCILDTNDDPEMTFDDHGVCNYCKKYDELSKVKLLSQSDKAAELEQILGKIKAAGKNKEYDCVLGVSGGVDSTYAAYKIKELGLRPLVIHYDNGWNSELAVSNIENVLKRLGWDLYTFVNDWEEFKDMQIAFIKASVIDIELVYDQALIATLFIEAHNRGIKYIITGHNFVTEAIMPKNWSHWKRDVPNIIDIHKKFGTVKRKSYPLLGYFRNVYYNRIYGMNVVNILDYMDYNKDEAKKLLIDKLGWKDYGGKHYESVFTRFYQGYILPVKFIVDKRKAHLSTLINSGQISREEALKEIARPPYDPEQFKQDKEYVLKKFGFTEEEFDKIMKAPAVPHLKYDSYWKKHYKYEIWLSKTFKPITKPLKKIFKIRLKPI